MNTPKTGMRTILAAAAAGALVLGSAAGVSAAPGKGKGPKVAVQMQAVSIQGHSPVNFFSPESVRTIKVRATVRDTKDVLKAPTVKMTLAQFTKKVNGQPVVNDAIDDPTIEVTLEAVKETSKSKYFSGVYTFDAEQKAAIKTYLATASTKTYLCIATAELYEGEALYEGETYANQVERRLNLNLTKKKPVRDCVKLVDIDPTKTTTKTDDAPAPVAPVTS